MNGFSLPELLVALALFTGVGLALFSLQADIFILNDTTRQSLRAQQDLRSTLKTLTAELRAAQSSDTGAYPIEQTNATALIFYSDTDGNGTRERLHYFLQGSTLRRGVLAPSGSPASYILTNEQVGDTVKNVIATTTPLFSYYASGFTASSSPLAVPVRVDEVRLVKIQIAIEAEPTRAPGVIVGSTQVSIRNLKDNL